MKTLSASIARSRFPTLLEEVRRTHERVVITRHGEPVAQLAPMEPHKTQSHAHPLRGMPVKMSRDFNAPMDDLWSALGE